MDINKQLFFSHTWRADLLGRDTHKRVHELVKKIREEGWTTWFDEEDMGGNIDAAMANGIDHAEAIIVCLTETYCKKVNETAKDQRKRDNCLKEWTYANTRNKLMVPVVMEPALLNISDWPPGVVSLYLSSILYIDASKADLMPAVKSITKFLSQQGLSPSKKLHIISTPIQSPKCSPPLQALPNILDIPELPLNKSRHSSPIRLNSSTYLSSFIKRRSPPGSRSPKRSISPTSKKSHIETRPIIRTNSLSRLSNIIHTISLSRSNSNKKLDNISVRSLSLSDKPGAIYLNAFKNTRSRSRSTGQLQDLAL